MTEGETFRKDINSMAIKKVKLPYGLRCFVSYYHIVPVILLRWIVCFLFAEGTANTKQGKLGLQVES